MSSVIAGVSRALLALLGGIWGGSDAEIGAAVRGFIEQLASGDTNAMGGTVVTLIAIAWSIYDKKKSKLKRSQNELDDSIDCKCRA